MHRRTLLKGAAGGAAALTFGSSFWRDAFALPAKPGKGPYGPLLDPNAHSLALPDGFSSRIVGLSGALVKGTTHQWHAAPDGAATFATNDGGWVLVSNAELSAGSGGVGAIRFRPRGAIANAYSILSGTSRNCAGGPTPWRTWLSCEETATGQVWECKVGKAGQGISRPALGRFNHEAAVVDPGRGHVYLTEDAFDGLLYRFTPDQKGDLSSGRLQAARRKDDGTVAWHTVPDPSATVTPTRHQVPSATPFARGEGMWFDSGVVYFTTTADHRVWAYDCKTRELEIIYDVADNAKLALRNPDNITVHRRSGDIFVAEDGDNRELVLITNPRAAQEGTRHRIVAPFLRVTGHPGSELTGPVFNPDGSRLYVSSQRGSGTGAAGSGVTYEIKGPFRTIPKHRR
jgi:secreted PhoX family phosphatase